jgi:hypothetical protein
MLPERDRVGWNGFMQEWSAATPSQKLLILGRKLAFVLLFVLSILAARSFAG